MPYSIVETRLPETLLLEPTVFGDDRGWFFESFNAMDFARVSGLARNFVQDNHSRSENNVLRGLHYQVGKPQGKLVRVVRGEVFDVAVDIRKASSNFGRWMGVHLSDQNKRQLWIPEGFAHGFLVVSDWAEVLYKTTDYYAPNLERCIAWNDSDIGIEWPTGGDPILSTKDRNGKRLGDSELFLD